MIQLAVPDSLRGRLSGLQIAVVSGGPRIGDLESGAVAAAFGGSLAMVAAGERESEPGPDNAWQVGRDVPAETVFDM